MQIYSEKKLYEKLIIIYEEHISNVEESEDNFLIFISNSVNIRLP